MSQFWHPDRLVQMTNGSWINTPDSAVDVTGVSIDTRTIEPGQAFVAIRGDRFDGHDFVAKAIDAGASMVIVDRLDSVEDDLGDTVPVLVVPDSIEAMTAMATEYRDQISAKVIGITGSAGKTTTKQLVYAALSSKFKGTASPKSFNNHIGVPLTLLNVDPSDEFVIAEIGTNSPGEIEALARIARPDISVITHVGPAHLEKLKTIEGVAREKSALVYHTKESGMSFVTGDCKELTDLLLADPPKVKYLTHGTSSHNCIQLGEVQSDIDAHGLPYVRFTLDGVSWYDANMMGRHNALNAMIAVVIARYLGMTPEEIATSLKANTRPAEMRLSIERIPVGGNEIITIINDAYNANPSSMSAALEVIQSYPTNGRRVAILGEMLELGDQSEELHEQLGQGLAGSSLDFMVLIGKSMRKAADAALEMRDQSSIMYTPTIDQRIGNKVVSRLQPGDVVLIKASRGLALERFVPLIKSRYGSEEEEAIQSS